VSGNVVGGEEWLFFMKEVQPLLSGESVNFRGESTFEQKIGLMKNAKALLFPIDRREPFGLVMIESMACGTPVIAYRCGSVPEVIRHGENGFICGNEEEMLKFMQKTDQIDRRACRKFVEENYTTAKMVDAYEKIYEKITGPHLR
jgi:glycosyltransferase involved in cell wall biosynthesis